MPAKILILEDEMLVAFEVEAVLGELGHEVVGIAPDMGTALSGAMRPIDLALVDPNLRDGLRCGCSNKRHNPLLAIVWGRADPAVA